VGSCSFDRKLLATQAAINHFLPQVEERQFQLVLKIV
jgi:hypothetical protein